MIEKNCAFQYAKITGQTFRRTEIVCDKSELTLDEAKKAEMVIWIDMPNAHYYGNSLEYISADAESDGVSIWETRKNYFTKNFQPVQK